MGRFLRDSGDDLQRGTVRAAPAPYGAPRPITAAAERVDIEAVGFTPRTPAKWQKEAWRAYERVGELHYGFGMKANLLSRVRVLAAVPGGPGDVPVDVAEAVKTTEGTDKESVISRELARDAAEVMSELVDSGFEAMCRTYSLCMDIPGEVYLAHVPTGETEPLIDPTTGAQVLNRATGKPMTRPVLEWRMLSTSELEVTTSGKKLVGGPTSKQNQDLPRDTYVARIWRKHPEFSSEPDSSLMALGDDVEMLLMLGRMVRGALLSRLNAGILFVPDSIAPVTKSTSVAEVTLDGDPLLGASVDTGGQFLDALMEAMVTPIGDEGSASNVVPLLLTGPGGEGEKIQHITLERKSDEWLANRMERYLERILQGADLPKELVTGLANVKYSNAIVITDDLYKSSIEPACLTFVDALTRVYLRPMLQARGHSAEDVARVVAWYDPSEITTRAATTADAKAGYEAGLLSPTAWRREHGFGEGDAPSEEERAMRLAEKAVLPPEVLQAFLRSAFPKLLAEAAEQNAAEAEVPMPDTARNLLRPVPDAATPPEPEVSPNGTPAPTAEAV